MDMMEGSNFILEIRDKKEICRYLVIILWETETENRLKDDIFHPPSIPDLSISTKEKKRL